MRGAASLHFGGRFYSKPRALLCPGLSASAGQRLLPQGSTEDPAAPAPVPSSWAYSESTEKGRGFFHSDPEQLLYCDQLITAVGTASRNSGWMKQQRLNIPKDSVQWASQHTDPLHREKW